MTDAAVDIKKSDILLENLIPKCENSIKALNELVNKAENHVKEKVHQNGSLDSKLLEKEQFVCHGFAWLKTYNIALGFEPIGHKHKRGDGKTPEGLYYINKKLHNSDFHIALQISYPNKWDKRKAKINSNNPGGLIMIHGQSKNLELNTEDWTNGCIAVTNEEIEEINKLVELKTPVYISK